MARNMALQCSSGQIVTIYTDSAYVYGVIHKDLAAWKKLGFVTAKGEPVAH